MLKKTVEYLLQNREVLNQVLAGNACLVGLSEVEQKAIADVFNKPDRYAVVVMGMWR